MIFIQKRYQDVAEQISETDVDHVRLNLATTRKVCCGGREKKHYDLGWIDRPGDMMITNVKDYKIIDRVLEVWIEP